MATVVYDNASRIFAKGARPAVDQLNLDIADGEFLVLVGPSGCGKSTSLRMLAGLEPTDAGRILIDGHDATGVAPRDRDVAMVFQSYALYPNMNVGQNMGFALRNAGVSKAETARKVREAADMLQLTEYLDRKPGALSGGQRQRVAMGRAIVRDPKVFCMDEPLSNLDAKLRVSTRGQISALQKRLGTTTVYVTHDQVEAMTMGDRVAVLKDGVLQQVDTPRHLYDTPANAFVASFIGSPAMTLFDVPVVHSQVQLGDVAIDIPRAIDDQLDQERVTVGIRPEDWILVGEGHDYAATLKIEHVEELGNEAFGYGQLRSDTPLAFAFSDANSKVAVRGDRSDNLQPFTQVRVSPKPGAVHFFHPASGIRLGSN